jgi:hypothetical protein
MRLFLVFDEQEKRKLKNATQPEKTKVFPELRWTSTLLRVSDSTPQRDIFGRVVVMMDRNEK